MDAALRRIEAARCHFYKDPGHDGRLSAAARRASNFSSEELEVYDADYHSRHHEEQDCGENGDDNFKPLLLLLLLPEKLRLTRQGRILLLLLPVELCLAGG